MKPHMNRKRAEQLLDEARFTQTAFWDALLALEEELGVEVDDSKDLEEQTIDSLLEEDTPV